MKNRLPFIIPETDLFYRVARILVLINTLSFSSKGNPVLTIEKMSIFDFLLKYPFILNEVLIAKNQPSISMLNREQGTIESLFPNKAALFNYSANKELLKLLIAYSLIEVEVLKGDIYYKISVNGINLINSIENETIIRLIQLSEALLPLRSVKTNELKKIINPLVEGV
jgi:hypothetical protein